MKQLSKVVIPMHVMARQVGDDMVILDLSKGSYFGLDAIGAQVWLLMVEGKSLADICDALMAGYDVSREELERDVSSLVDKLLAEELISLD